VLWLFTCRSSGQAVIYFPPRITQQLLLLNVVCLCMRGKVRQMRSTSGVLNRSVISWWLYICALNNASFLALPCQTGRWWQAMPDWHIVLYLSGCLLPNLWTWYFDKKWTNFYDSWQMIQDGAIVTIQELVFNFWCHFQLYWIMSNPDYVKGMPLFDIGTVEY